jgi:hypothetical protein
MRLRTKVEVVSAAAVVVLLAAAVYELVVAAGVLSLGPLPGDDAAGADLIRTAGFLALLAGVVTSFANAARRDPSAAVPLKLLAPAAAAVVVAHFYAFDSYYVPTLRRASEAGLFPARWIFLLAIASVAAAGLVATRPRAGCAFASVVLVCVPSLRCSNTAATSRFGSRAAGKPARRGSSAARGSPGGRA